ncbi:helix-turn-helix domain-containing protein [Pseudomonas fragi]|uniref:helix-turn-helix domain-containing protein n=1 Tax=Pseudomonas fragi TaxID=296 RepID=UPI002006A8F3|nr:helix-turn-helix transcriptional regulator [Pseudomonas fragi]
MTGKLIDLAQARGLKQDEIDRRMWLLAEDLPLGFSESHCVEAREMLDWSVETLAFRSGVSVKAIRELELGIRKLRRVTMQALSFSLEKEGLIFIPGHDPMRGQNCRGGTTNPRGRDDFHLIE